MHEVMSRALLYGGAVVAVGFKVLCDAHGAQVAMTPQYAGGLRRGLRSTWLTGLTGEWATSGLRFSERFPLN